MRGFRVFALEKPRMEPRRTEEQSTRAPQREALVRKQHVTAFATNLQKVLARRPNPPSHHWVLREARRESLGRGLVVTLF